MKPKDYPHHLMPSLTTTQPALSGEHAVNANPSTWTLFDYEGNTDMDVYDFYYPDSDMPADELFATGEATIVVRDRITQSLNGCAVTNHGPGVYAAEADADGTIIGATGASYYDAVYQLALQLTKHYGLPF